MRETHFIKHNSENWSEAEKILTGKQDNPARASKLYTNVANNYSYARTHFYNRRVRVYLNELNQNLYSLIYKNKKQNGFKVADFWKYKLPLLIYECRKELLLSLLIFTTATAIGVLSASQDPDFTRTILGDNYIETTLKNIENGDPMAIYKASQKLNMFLSITINNIRVAFQAFILGIFWAVGTFLILMYNGIMLGSFEYFFVERNLFFESFLSIWQHGVIEISSVIIAGGAGFVLSNGMLFPGTYSRSIALRTSALKGVKIMISLVPLFIIAGFIEAFFTRETDLPNWIRIASILFSSTFIIGYFVVLPILAHRKFAVEKPEIKELELPNDGKEAKTILNAPEIVSAMLNKVFDLSGKIIGYLIAVSVAYAILIVQLNLQQSYSSDTSGIFSYLPPISLKTLGLFMLQCIVFGFLNWKSYVLLTDKIEKKYWSHFALISLVLALPALLLAPLDYVFCIVMQPLLFSILYLKIKAYSIKNAIKLIFRNFIRFIGPYVLTAVLGLFSSGILMLVSLYKEFFIDWNFVDSGIVEKEKLIQFTGNLTWQLYLIAILFIINTVTIISLKSILEIDTAADLKVRIQNIGKNRKFKFEK